MEFRQQHQLGAQLGRAGDTVGRGRTILVGFGAHGVLDQGDVEAARTHPSAAGMCMLAQCGPPDCVIMAAAGTWTIRRSGSSSARMSQAASSWRLP